MNQIFCSKVEFRLCRFLATFCCHVIDAAALQGEVQEGGKGGGGEEE
jgi:hypothetical protein